ncbi:MAG: exosortase system-associated protein, TIGR04073 family [Candidatus Omnitrophota bacterium]
MKKTVLFLAAALIFSCAQAHAVLKDEMDSGKALDKLGRGVANVITGPGEVLYQMPGAMESSPDYISGFVKAIGRGIKYGFLRTGAGIYDIATAPFPGPSKYKPITKPGTPETIADRVLNTTISRTLS